MYFNPRTREECDLHRDWDLATEEQFQSTHSRGVRLIKVSLYWYAYIKFQSTHSRGVRHVLLFLLDIQYYFNPRTREECDNLSILALCHLGYFNPRTREECDYICGSTIFVKYEFQSTHSRGVRPSACDN